MEFIIEEIRSIEGELQQGNLTTEEGRELQEELNRLYVELENE